MKQDTKRADHHSVVKLIVACMMIILVAMMTGCSLGTKDTAQKPINILVMGVDHREGDVGRSDSLFVLSINREDNIMAMTSIPRDSLVMIPGHGWDKINHAYAYGEEKLTRRTVENLLDTKIDYLVKLETKGVEKIIDAIGGVEIDVEKRMKYEDPWDDDGGLVIDLKPGEQTLDGARAVQYIRYRDEEGDIGRAHRQQKFLEAAVDSVVSPLTLFRLPRIVYACVSAIDTDMPTIEMVKLMPTAMLAAHNGLVKIFADGEPTYINGVSYWSLDIQNLRAKMACVMGEHRSGASMRDAARMEETARYQQIADTERKMEEEKKAQAEKERLEKEKKEKELKNKQKTEANDDRKKETTKKRVNKQSERENR